MDDKEKEYEAEYKKFKRENIQYLAVFVDDMVKEGLPKEIIEGHYKNVDFYLNIYLLRDGGDDMLSGCSDIIENYFGYYFIQKCSWASPSTMKETADSIEKFYKSMLEHGFVGKEDFETFCSVIENGLAGWQDFCALFK